MPGALGRDLSTWDVWWHYNGAPYLQLKSAVHANLWTGDDFANPSWRTALRPSEETIRTKIVPALVALLAKERSDHVLTSAMLALARIGDAPSASDAHDGATDSLLEPLFLPFLKHPSQTVSEVAAISLGILAHPSSVDVLESLVRDDERGRELAGGRAVSERTRAFAAYGLGMIGQRSPSERTRQLVARALTDILARPAGASDDVHVAAVIALGLVPLAVEDRVVADGAPERGPERSSVPWLTRQTQVRFLAQVQRDPEQRPFVRAHAATALARLAAEASPALRDEFARALLDSSKSGGSQTGAAAKTTNEVRQSFALALGHLGDRDTGALDVEMRAALRAFSEGSDHETQSFARIALGQVGGRLGLGEGNEVGLAECRRILLDGLTQGPSRTRSWSALALGILERANLDSGGLGSSTVRGELRTALKRGGSADELGALAIALGLARDLEASAALHERLKTCSDDTARAFLGIGLAMIGDRTAVPALQAIVRSARYRPLLLQQASIALALLGDKELVPELAAMLADAQGQSSQAAIASALGFIGDARSVEPLIEMLVRKDITDSARGFAASALGMVADREPLPWTTRISLDLNYLASPATLVGGDGAGILEIL